MSDVKVTIDLTGTETPRSRTGRTREEIAAEAEAKRAQKAAEKEQKQIERAAEKERKDQESIANKRKKDLESAMQDELSAREAVIQKMASSLGFGEVFNFIKSIEKVQSSAERVEKLASLGKDTIPTKLNETGIALEGFVDKIKGLFDRMTSMSDSDVVMAERVDDTASSAEKVDDAVDQAARRSQKMDRQLGDTFPIKRKNKNEDDSNVIKSKNENLNVRYREFKPEPDDLFKRIKAIERFGPNLPKQATATGSGGGGVIPPKTTAASGGAGGGSSASLISASTVLSTVAVVAIVVLAIKALSVVADKLARKFSELDRWVGDNVIAFSKYSSVLSSELALRNLNRIQQEMKAGSALEARGTEYIRKQAELDTAAIESRTELSQLLIPAINDIKSNLTNYMKMFNEFLRIINDSNLPDLTTMTSSIMRPMSMMDPFLTKFWGNMYDTMKSAMSASSEELAEEAGNEVERELAEFFGFDMARVMNPKMRRELPLFEGNIED